MATLSRANCGKVMCDTIPAIYNLIEKIPLECTEQIMIPIVHLKFFEAREKKESPIAVNETNIVQGDKVDDTDDTPDDYKEDYKIVDPQSMMVEPQELLSTDKGDVTPVRDDKDLKEQELKDIKIE